MKTYTVRLPDDVAADVEALARVSGASINETIKRAISEQVERDRSAPEFRSRLQQIIAEDRELLERLAR
jgi:predicted transcriptional regulator